MDTKYLLKKTKNEFSRSIKKHYRWGIITNTAVFEILFIIINWDYFDILLKQEWTKPVITILFAAPVAFWLWVFRNNDKKHDFEHHERDLTLKENNDAWDNLVKFQNVIDDKQATNAKKTIAILGLAEFYNHKDFKFSRQAHALFKIYLNEFWTKEHIFSVNQNNTPHIPEYIKTIYEVIQRQSHKVRNEKNFFHQDNGLNFEDFKLQYSDLRNINFSNSNLSNANLHDSCLIKANLYNVNLEKVNLTDTDLTGACLRNANLEHKILNNTKLVNVDLSWANLTNITLKGIGNKGLDLSNSYLCNANLTGSNLNNSNLYNVKLNNATLTNANLKNVILNESELKNAKLVKIDLTSSELKNVNLKKAKLENANLWRADLTNSNLTNAYLNKANLWRTVLKKAKIISVDLKHAKNLGFAYLDEANFCDVDLSGAELMNIDLRIIKKLDKTKLQMAKYCLTPEALTKIPDHIIPEECNMILVDEYGNKVKTDLHISQIDQS